MISVPNQLGPSSLFIANSSGIFLVYDLTEFSNLVCQMPIDE